MDKVGVFHAKPNIYEGHIHVCRIGLYPYKYRIYSTISTFILKGLAPVYQMI